MRPTDKATVVATTLALFKEKFVRFQANLAAAEPLFAVTHGPRPTAFLRSSAPFWRPGLPPPEVVGWGGVGGVLKKPPPPVWGGSDS